MRCEVADVKESQIHHAGPRVILHALRLSAATFKLMHGVPLHTASKWVGRASVALTSQLYGHVLEDSMRDAANILQRAYIPGE